MTPTEEKFIAFTAQPADDDFAALVRREVSASPAAVVAAASPVIGRLHGFDLLDQPLVGDLAMRQGHVLSARTTIPLLRSMIGRDVVVWFEGGDRQAPIIMGLIEPRALIEPDASTEPGVVVQTDGERHLITAEREIVLRCGDASITLTRAGKVIIKGNYILSRSNGYNKIKGAAIDIN